MVQPKLTYSSGYTSVNNGDTVVCWKLEALAFQIARLSYPVRLDLSKFFKKYCILLSTAVPAAFLKNLDEAATSDHLML
jgi:hypothetical protein